MSAISSSTGGQSLFQYLQTLSGSQQTSSTAATAATSATSATTATTPTQDTDGDSNGSTPQVSGGHHHHHGGGKGGGALFQQIQSAVTSALQSAQSGGTSTDPNKTIQAAIEKVLKNLQNPPTTTSGQTTASGQTAAAGSDPDGDGDTDAAGVADSDGSSTSSSTASTTSSSATTARTAFAQLLKSNGVDPQQFHQDFLSAIQSAQSGGTTDTSSVFGSFPTGSVVDTIG